MSKNGIVLNTLGRDKGRLVGRNKIMKTTFEPISQNFGDNFVDNVAKVDGSKMIDRERPQLFRH
jgi:hypothetical protein